MKIKLIKNGSGTKKEFKNKLELFVFVQNHIANTIYSKDEQENKKIKILKTNNYNKFNIYELVNMIDYKMEG